MIFIIKLLVSYISIIIVINVKRIHKIKHYIIIIIIVVNSNYEYVIINSNYIYI